MIDRILDRFSTSEGLCLVLDGCEQEFSIGQRFVNDGEEQVIKKVVRGAHGRIGIFVEKQNESL